MRIAYLTQEFPPIGGGIGSYIYEAARLMAAAGHDVEVFITVSPNQRLHPLSGVKIHELPLAQSTEGVWLDFAEAVSKRHAEVPFDVVESPEYNALATGLRQQLPTLPLVVKLHSATALIRELNTILPGWKDRWRFRLGAWRRLQRAQPYWLSEKSDRDPELDLIRASDLVVAPSNAVGEDCTNRWNIPHQHWIWVPYPYEPSKELLALPAAPAGARITFLGRLERRKGVIELARALPAVFRACPNASIQFVGKAMPSPQSGIDMKTYLQRELSDWKNRVSFCHIPREQLHEVFAASDITVLPSLWESFGYVCLEAMAAAQAVVGSEHGGMAEIIEHGHSGLLATPKHPATISKALIRLIRYPDLQEKLRKQARQRVLNAYGSSAIVPRLEQSYQEAIRRHRSSSV